MVEVACLNLLKENQSEPLGLTSIVNVDVPVLFPVSHPLVKSTSTLLAPLTIKYPLSILPFTSIFNSFTR